VNDVADPVVNPAGAPIVSLAEILAAVTRALKTWNDIPTSYIQMRVVGTVSNPLDAAFDMVNEVHFGNSFFGTRARLVRLVEDTRLVDGDDLNDDGVADVSSKLARCQDVRGHTVFPAGFYRAGTILDVDLQWDTDSHPLAVRDADLANLRVFDFQGIATHEFGHALGLAHSLHTQRSSRDGRDAIMGGSFTRDPVFKRMQRTLDSDDVAWASYLYPEGSAAAGPAALQPGDVAFASRYGLITGSLRHGRMHLPIPGAVVVAKDLRTREIVSSGYTGSILLSGDPVTGEILYLPAEQGIVDGRFVIPVPAGSYSLTVRPTGLPPYPISYTNDAGAPYGLLDFHEEGVDRHDDAVEYRPGDVNPLRVLAGRTTSGVGIVTNRTIDVTQVGPYNTMSVAALETPEGTVPFRYEAVRIPAARYAELTHSRAMPILAALFLTQPADPSAIQRFPGAMLTTGSVNADGTAAVDLANPLVRIGSFVGRDFQLTPIYFEDSRTLGVRVDGAIARGEVSDLFLVLALPSRPYPGPSNRPPLTGRSCSGVQATNSFYSTDGATFVPLPFCEHVFSLIVAEPLR
jgi:hypothetical protein